MAEYALGVRTLGDAFFLRNRALAMLEEAAGEDCSLVMITNRGQKVYPDGLPETFCVDHWRCRFQPKAPEAPMPRAATVALLERLDRAGVDADGDGRAGRRAHRS